MKIATYNIWNDEKTLELRSSQLIQEIRTVDADIIGLQEVTTEFYQNYLVKETGYLHHVFMQYPGEEEGLAVLSRYPLDNPKALFDQEAYENSLAVHIFFEIAGMRFSFTNVHLPWDSVKARERQIAAIDRYIHEQEADFFILLGDFNGDIGSSVDRYLVGDQTLNGCEANPCWNDLASAYAARNGEPVRELWIW
ncbi:MAG: endonuclease/exonuclease/phosphatase family protein [Lachnospiraceae bacterium]|nr:endonuclease/exonuclease/phosphatase family protein [Lachnospiraceae bacterium]